MKILMVNTLYPPSNVGGAERSVALLARAAAARGHEVHVVCLHNGQTAYEEDDNGVTVHRLRLRNRYWPFESAKRRSAVARLLWHVKDSHNVKATNDVIKIAEAVCPDVIHTNNLLGFSTEIWKWANKKDIRVVHTLRDYGVICARATLFRASRDCKRRCYSCILLTERKRYTARLVDAVASNSQYVIEAHRRFGYFKRTPSQVIFNISDHLPNPAPAVICKNGDPSGIVVFGYIGRVEVEKGIEIVLEAFERLAPDNWQLKIAGSGKNAYVDSLALRYKDNRIEWLSFVDPDVLYSSVDAVILSSIWPEPLPRTMIECLSRGIPMIYSDAGGIPEIGGLSPQSVMYSKDDVDELAKCLADVLNDPLKWITRFAPQPDSLAMFTEEVVVERYLDLYRGQADPSSPDQPASCRKRVRFRR